jgi:predicted dehydrogenase
MDSIRFAVIGAGGFAFFAVSEFVKILHVELVGVFDEVPQNSSRFQVINPELRIYRSMEEVLMDQSVDLVYIATPPYLHYEQSLAALTVGKHVICEKPAAIRLSDAIELRDFAEKNNLLFVVNLMQRYNFFFDVIREMIDEKVLGEFLHGFFENYASDEALTPDHWFWDESKSGGIFIEHGVHFFDLFSGWLGDGQVITSQKLKRTGYENVWDKVQATVRYGGRIVNFYHAFDQPKAMDRQEMRLQFERGELTLYEWVPTRMKMTALCTHEQLGFFRSRFPLANLEFLESHEKPRVVRGHFKDITYQYKVALDTGDTIQKQDLYQNLLRRMLVDQLDWIKDRSHVRKVTAENAVESLRLAEAAEEGSVKIYYL